MAESEPWGCLEPQKQGNRSGNRSGLLGAQQGGDRNKTKREGKEDVQECWQGTGAPEEQRGCSAGRWEPLAGGPRAESCRRVTGCCLW